jgi:hypothetical protein
MQSRYDMAAGPDLPIRYSARPQIIQIVGEGGVLPIQLVSFTAVQQDKVVRINWHVQYENLSKYIVERSAGGEHYSPIATVNATGETNYGSVDDSPVAGKNYYRLKMISKDGSVTYSPIRLVVINGGKIKYIAYNYLGQKLTEGDDFAEINKRARMMLRSWQPYIISGSDGTVIKLLKQQD